MTTLWAILRKKSNREIISWLGGGAVIVIGGLWALFVYIFPPKPPQEKRPTWLVLADAELLEGANGVSLLRATVNNLTESAASIQRIDIWQTIREMFSANLSI